MLSKASLTEYFGDFLHTVRSGHAAIKREALTDLLTLLEHKRHTGFNQHLSILITTLFWPLY